MYINLRDLSRVEFSCDIEITEFIPYDRSRYGEVTFVPLNEFGQPMVAFEETGIYQNEGDFYADMYNMEYTMGIVSFDFYRAELKRYVATIEAINYGQIKVTFKGSEEDLYMRYKNAISHCAVAGVLYYHPKYDDVLTENKNTITFTPPEGVKHRVGFETYCITAKLLLPMVIWDYSTLYATYVRYMQVRKNENKEPQENVLWFMLQNRTLEDMTALVDNAMGYTPFTRDQILSHLEENIDLDMTELCRNMLLQYNISPVGVDKLLLYSSAVVGDTYAGAKKHADITSDQNWVRCWCDDIINPEVEDTLPRANNNISII